MAVLANVSGRPTATVQTALRPRSRTNVSIIAASAAVSVAVVLSSLSWPAHVVNPGARAAIETIVAISALVTAALLLLQFRRRRRTDDLLLLGALAAVATIDFVFSALPDLIGRVGMPFGTDARTIAQALVPVAFLTAAFAPGRTTVAGRPWRAAMIGLACAAAVVLAEVLDLVVGRSSSSGDVASSAAAWVSVGSAVALVVAGIGFAERSRSTRPRGALLAGASFLLAAARLQYLAIPSVAANWVTAREGLRVAAYALLLAAVATEYMRMCREEREAAVATERERIARDVHDGIAQDLAVIVFHAQRLESEFGAGHPLTVAARRALAASRQTIVDLAGSSAPSTVTALRDVADELHDRFGIEIDVRNEVEDYSEAAELDSNDREQVVRIAREAIVNAARHGDAHHVDVVLQGRGTRWLLRVSDDGCGIPDSAFMTTTGFGLRSMRVRAEEVGGHLSARRRASGGTVLELSLAGRRRR